MTNQLLKTRFLISRRIASVFVLAAVIAGGISSRAYGNTQAGTSLPAAASAYRIEPGDILDISVVDEQQLSKVVTVVPDGTISYPYLGEVKVSGLTTGELRRRIAAALKDQLVDPEVTVAISRRREKSVSVIGAVKLSGRRPLQDGWRVLDVLADCGGLTVRPEWASATIARGDGSEQVKLDLVRLLAQADAGDNLLLVSGDILLVQEKEASQTQVQVVGEVLRPGPAAVPPDGSVIAVLNEVGGAAPGAALAEAVILRAGQALPLNLLGYSDTGKVPGNVRLQPGDTLVVPRNKKQFAVLGAVLRPGASAYPENGGLDVIGALTLAGGAITEADLKGSLILRKGKGITAGSQEVATVKVDLSDALSKGKPSLSIPLEAGDILYIPNRRGRTSGVGLSQLLSVVPLIGFFVR